MGSAMPRSGTGFLQPAAAAIDPRRRLVLARCDGREVLLLVGGPTDTVVGWLPAARPAMPAPHHGPLPPSDAVDDLA